MSTPTSMGRLVGFFALAVGLAGCDRGPTMKITHTREASHPSSPVKLDATSAERFAAGRHMAGMGGGGARGPRPSPLAWTVPEGWKEKPPTEMRVGSFAVGPNGEGDCSIAITGGELVPNINRWMGQFGLQPLTVEAIMKLPTRPFIGGQGTVVEAEGTYGGMGGEGAKPGFKLLAIITERQAPQGAAICVVKLVGPAALVEAERARFHALCDSLRPNAAEDEGDDDHAGHDHAGHDHGKPVPTPESQTPKLEWAAPPEWKKKPEPPGSMRIVSFEATPNTECYVTAMAGNADKLAANLNRWRGMFGLGPLDDASIGALPKVKVFGQDVPLVELGGDYTDMQSQHHAGYGMLGAIGLKDGTSVFVRITGPSAEVGLERERFLAFLGSLR